MEINSGDIIYVIHAFDISTGEMGKPFLAFFDKASAYSYCKKINDGNSGLRMYYDEVMLNVTDWTDEF